MDEYVLVRSDELAERLDRMERRLEGLLRRVISEEELMASQESAEALALQGAIEGLQAELADVGSVDAEVVVDLEGVAAALGKVNPTTVEQVNAVTAATEQLKSLTGKLKAAGAAEQGAVNPPAPAPAEPPQPPVEAPQEAGTPPAPAPQEAPGPEVPPAVS